MAFDKSYRDIESRPGTEKQWSSHNWAWLDNTKLLRVSKRCLENVYYASQKELDIKIQRLKKIKYMLKRRKMKQIKKANKCILCLKEVKVNSSNGYKCKECEELFGVLNEIKF